MLTTQQMKSLDELANGALDAAERVWEQVGDELVFSASSRAFLRKMAESVETQIPGYPTVELGKPKVDDFIAIVADMRGSTSHLLQAISGKTAKVSQLQRVFYETATLLPCLAKSIGYEGGNVTEYLGDGVLGLFSVDSKNRDESVYAANRAASKCLDAVRDVVNPTLRTRYSLPALEIGVGMGFSKAVVTLVGLPDFMQPIVFGECVFRASKLSSGPNEVLVDKALKQIWPTSKGGVLRFVPKTRRGVEGYLVQRKDS